jgi:hypothetical protein
MNYFHKGIAPVILVLLVALGLAGGASAGYVWREPIKKALTGTTTSEDIDKIVDQTKLGQSKFELEGVATSIDNTNSIINVSIKSSSASIKQMRLSNTPILVEKTTIISNSNKKDLKLIDVPIESKVHIAGVVNDGQLSATKITIQKDEANQNVNNRFAVGGTVKEIGETELKIEVKTANSKVKDQKGKEITIKTDSTTIIEKADAIVLLSDVKVDDEVQISGVIVEEEYLASKIEIKVKEKAGELELEEESNSNQNQRDSSKNKETETETETESDSTKNKSNSNAGGNSSKLPQQS